MCFNLKTMHCKAIENLFFDILLPQSKPITIGFYYIPPNQAKFINLMIEEFSNFNIEDIQIYLLSDFNINLSQNDK